MRLKYYLRGLGVGLIVATLILTISNNVRRIEAGSVVNDATEEESKGSALAFDKDAVQETTDESLNDQATTDSAVATTEAAKVQVTIKDINYSTQVVDILYDAGVITDKEAFSQYMRTSGYSRKIRQGVYELTVGDSFENIAKIITRSK